MPKKKFNLTYSTLFIETNWEYLEPTSVDLPVNSGHKDEPVRTHM